MRISPQLIRHAAKENKLLPLLLKATRTLDLARTELNWIQNELPKVQWKDACIKRHNLVPLQYILGSQPFGELDIKCREGVLIPRWETEEYTMKLVECFRQLNSDIKLLDVCTGTGCIPLLIAHHFPKFEIEAVDISSAALELANENKQLNKISNVTFTRDDMFDSKLGHKNFDFLVSNPPYIPQKEYFSIEKSTRRFEPELALMGGELNYKALVENYVDKLGITGFLFELGSLSQGECVQKLLGQNWRSKFVKDSNDQVRVLLGWKVNSKFEILSSIS